DRLTSGKLGTSVAPPDMRDAPLYPDISIGIMPLNELPSTVNLPDVCVVLESKWLVRCEVLEGLRISDEDILVAVTGRDIFGPSTNYVFSWQQRDTGSGTGVISAYRFATGDADFYEKDSVPTRR